MTADIILDGVTAQRSQIAVDRLMSGLIPWGPGSYEVGVEPLCAYQWQILDEEDTMSTSIGQGKVQVIHGSQSASTTTQTPGMERRPGIDSNTVGAQRIWLGHVTAFPNETGPPHHHGEAETAAYILSGRVRVYFGEDFKEYVEAGPGDFIFVPAWLHHIEANPSPDEPMESVLSRSPDNIVVNLE